MNTRSGSLFVWPPRLVVAMPSVVLLLGGTVAGFVGLSLLTDPLRFYASYGLELDGQTSLLSEFRGNAGMLVSIAALLAMGAFTPKLRTPASGLGAVVYLGYAAGRGVGISVDGMPHPNLVYAAVAELALGLCCAWVYTRKAHQ